MRGQVHALPRPPPPPPPAWEVALRDEDAVLELIHEWRLLLRVAPDLPTYSDNDAATPVAPTAAAVQQSRRRPRPPSAGNHAAPPSPPRASCPAAPPPLPQTTCAPSPRTACGRPGSPLSATAPAKPSREGAAHRDAQERATHVRATPRALARESDAAAHATDGEDTPSSHAFEPPVACAPPLLRSKDASTAAPNTDVVASRRISNSCIDPARSQLGRSRHRTPALQADDVGSEPPVVQCHEPRSESVCPVLSEKSEELRLHVEAPSNAGLERSRLPCVAGKSELSHRSSTPFNRTKNPVCDLKTDACNLSSEAGSIDVKPEVQTKVDGIKKRYETVFEPTLKVLKRDSCSSFFYSGETAPSREEESPVQSMQSTKSSLVRTCRRQSDKTITGRLRVKRESARAHTFDSPSTAVGITRKCCSGYRRSLPDEVESCDRISPNCDCRCKKSRATSTTPERLRLFLPKPSPVKRSGEPGCHSNSYARFQLSKSDPSVISTGRPECTRSSVFEKRNEVLSAHAPRRELRTNSETQRGPSTHAANAADLPQPPTARSVFSKRLKTSSVHGVRSNRSIAKTRQGWNLKKNSFVRKAYVSEIRRNLEDDEVSCDAERELVCIDLCEPDNEVKSRKSVILSDRRSDSEQVAPSEDVGDAAIVLDLTISDNSDSSSSASEVPPLASPCQSHSTAHMRRRPEVSEAAPSRQRMSKQVSLCQRAAKADVAGNAQLALQLYLKALDRCKTDPKLENTIVGLAVRMGILASTESRRACDSFLRKKLHAWSSNVSYSRESADSEEVIVIE